MRINRVNTGHVAVATGINKSKGSTDGQSSRTGGAGGDKVQLSDAARQLAAAHTGGKERLSAERIGEVRQRIGDGYYDHPEIAEEVAVRMLAEGVV